MGVWLLLFADCLFLSQPSFLSFLAHRSRQSPLETETVQDQDNAALDAPITPDLVQELER